MNIDEITLPEQSFGRNLWVSRRAFDLLRSEDPYRYFDLPEEILESSQNKKDSTRLSDTPM